MNGASDAPYQSIESLSAYIKAHESMLHLYTANNYDNCYMYIISWCIISPMLSVQSASFYLGHYKVMLSYQHLAACQNDW